MRLVLAVAALLCACGGGVQYTSSTTKGVACGDFATTLCDKFISCGQAANADRSVCVDGVEGGCCGDNRTCGQKVANPTGAANCVMRLPSESCSNVSLSAQVLPSYCRQMF